MEAIAIDARAIIPVKCYPVVVVVIGDDFFLVLSAISPRIDCCSLEQIKNNYRPYRRGFLALFFSVTLPQ